MKISFDTSVLVAALVKELPDHRRALDCIKRHIENGSECCCSTHSLAECYSALTSLPLPQKILPSEAAQIIEVNLMKRLRILTISPSAYLRAIRNVADLGFKSGMVYDALHIACAEAGGCERIYTFNLKHFQRLNPKGVEILPP